MKFHFEKRVGIGFFSTFVVLLALALLSYSSTQRLINTSALSTHGITVISNADLVLKNIVDMETGERGFVITGNEAFLEPFYNASTPLNKYLSTLDSLTKSSSVQSKRTDTLHSLIDAKLAWTVHVIELRRKSFDEARTLIANESGKKITDSIRGCIKRLQGEEERVFKKGNTISGTSLQEFQFSFIGLALISTLIILYLFYLINKTLGDRKETESRFIKLNQELESKVEDRTRKLKESERIYRSLASNIPGSAITILDRDERYILAEGDMLKGMGYEKENMPGKKLSEVIAPDNYLFYQPLIATALKGETIVNERQTPSGLYALMKVVPLKDDDGDIFAIMFVLIDVTHLKAAQSALASANNNLELKIAERTEQLREANKDLDAFSHSVSHDLRAPLRAISGYAQMIKEDYASIIGEEGERITDLIISSGLRMGKLIDNLLDFSRQGRRQITSARINIDALVKEVLSDLVSLEVDRKINIDLRPLASTFGDINMLRQVWINLISNALKYSRKKEMTEIKIESFPENGEIIYSISDNGAGFDMMFADKLFGVFQRLHKMNEFEGTGVGLALVKTIIKRHRGRIWAEAKVNEGATFYFSLPAEG